jgi:uncharacterized protein (DUF1810 family)
VTPERIAELRKANIEGEFVGYMNTGERLFSRQRDLPECLDEIERLRRELSFRNLYGISHLHKLAAVWLLAQETTPDNALTSIKEEMLDGYFSGGIGSMTSEELFVKSEDSMSRALSIDFGTIS